MLETPSRIWRRIEAIEHRDMPSLPSLPPFEDSGEVEDDSQAKDGDNVELIDDENMPSPMHSTPTTASTYRGLGGNNSSTPGPRFANSIASMSTKSSNRMARRSQSDSLDIQSLLDVCPVVASDSDEEGIESKSTVPEAYLPPDENDYQISDPDFSLADALESVSREGSPPLIHGIIENTPKKNYDYSVSLRSEPKVRLPSSLIMHINSVPLSSLHLWRSIVMLRSARPTPEPGRHLSRVHPLPNRHRLAILPLRAIVLLQSLSHGVILLYYPLKFSLNWPHLQHTAMWGLSPCKIPISAI